MAGPMDAKGKMYLSHRGRMWELVFDGVYEVRWRWTREKTCVQDQMPWRTIRKMEKTRTRQKQEAIRLGQQSERCSQ